MDKGKLPPGPDLLRLSTLGLNFALSIFVGVLLGWGAQRLFHWGNWATLAGIFLGIGTGYYRFFTDLKAVESPPPASPLKPLPKDDDDDP